MNLKFFRRFSAVVSGLFLAANLALGQDANVPTNTPANASATVTRDEMTQNYLRIQEQVHETQMAVEKSQIAIANAAKDNADALAARLQSLEQSVAAQHATDAEAARKTQQLTLFLAGAFGLAGLGIMLLMVYFQWRAFTQLAQISLQQSPPLLANVNGSVHELAAP
ncbi:MAG TPA: hypothetical protein VFF11_15175, partial [Candidatus Binatia bacterium]|nr:hypothetical protein [Candidatus Binatia bacterium]